MSDHVYDAERFPTLGEAGRRMLDFLRNHPAAPIFRNASGNRLLATEVEQLREDFDGFFISAPNGVIHLLTSMNHPGQHFELNEAWILSEAADGIRIPISAIGNVNAKLVPGGDDAIS